MATNEKRYKITIDDNAAVKTLKTIGNGFNKLGKVGKSTLIGLGKAGKAGFKAIGGAMKAAGIGVMIGLFAALWEALKKNQKIMDLISDAINAMGIAIKPVVDAISSLVEKFGANNKLMDAMKTTIKNLIKLGLTPLKLSFNVIKLAVQELMLGWKKLKGAFGKSDADNKAIEQLEADIQKTKDTLKETAKEAIVAVKETVKAVQVIAKEAGPILKQVVKDTSDAYKKMSVDSIMAQADAMTQAKKNLETLALAQEKVAKIAETEAEKQRQLRDDDTLTFQERIDANNKLAEILKKQSTDEKAIIAQKIEQQKILNALDVENEEGKNALLALENELLDVDARITGQLSEQKTNVNSLNKERADASAEVIKIKEEEILRIAELEEEQREKDKQKIADDIKDADDARNAKFQAAQDGISKINQLDQDATDFRKNLLAKQLLQGKISQENYDKSIAKIDEKAAKRKKAYAIAGVIMDTASAIMNIWAKVADPTPIAAFKVAQTAVVGGLAAAQIAAISSQSTATSVPSVSPGTGSGSEAPSPSTSFSFDDGQNNAQQEQKPLKAYVTSSEIRTQDQLDRETKLNGSI